MKSPSARREPPSSTAPDSTIPDALHRIEEFITDRPGLALDALKCDRLGDELRHLHACVRAHHAAGFLVGTGGPQPDIPPELTGESQRLRNEHPHLIGLVDWLTRHVDAVSDQSPEDREIFDLRLRECVAVLRRHEAEEERLLQLALWNVTGGEG